VPNLFWSGGKTTRSHRAWDTPMRQTKAEIWMGVKPRPPFSMLVYHQSGDTVYVVRRDGTEDGDEVETYLLCMLDREASHDHREIEQPVHQAM
jgi:hypothetical protein